ncbi:FimV/HubP family polar landmark protein [Marinobacter sp. X15-166B]|uniref:FimV/HubP family polar landmark protein n=1 Tax=Marinobacter sp. X15-166B TaxID=1897620 RepID=UPI00085CC010|nr:FimV/HubP family polar landmark protein [Marinobacter sp. X15-166B]OEY67711.1 hypothetical protein BG841_15565 [Marinobacter sp. X15-166B]
MKVRKLAVALALVGGLGSGLAQALGLGEIELQSYLNEPLNAEIALRKSKGVQPGEVFVGLASEADYRRVGISRDYFLSKLKFDVGTTSSGNLVVNVTSREALREPYLNFLLEVTWPSGRLMREYAVLVDPPVYAEESGVRESIQAPQASSPAATASSPNRTQASGRSPRPAVGSGAAPRTYGATNQSDTLWGIALAVRPDNSVSPQQVMLALQDLNPDAFIGGNINRLKRGEVLRIPDMEQIQQRSRAEANRQVTAQNQALQTPTQEVDATARTAAEVTPATTTAGQGAVDGGSELKLLVAEDVSESGASDSGSAGGDGQLGGGADVGTAVALEELESARRENAELSERLTDLQDQVATLQRLLELKNNQLADLQGLSAQEAAPETSGEPLGGADAPADAGGAGLEAPVETAPAIADGEVTATDAEGAGPATDGAGVDTGTPVVTAESGVEAEPLADTVATPGPGQPVTEDPSGQTAVGGQEGVAAATPDSAEQPAATASAPQAEIEPDKGLVESIIHGITTNPLYQLVLGGSLVLLLLLLLLLARRNKRREQEFFEQLEAESAADPDHMAVAGFDLTLDDEEAESVAGAAEASDPIVEADALIANGRQDQAMQVLEAAISKEPSRTDLRVKLLGVYAETQDRSAFDKQFGELEALGNAEAVAEAQVLHQRLADTEAVPSIDELESQLMSGAETSAEIDPVRSEGFASVDLEEGAPEPLNLEADAAEEDTVDQPIEYDLSGISEAQKADEAPTADSQDDDLSLDFGDLDISFESAEAESPSLTEADFATLDQDGDSAATDSPQSLVEQFEETGRDELGVFGSSDEPSLEPLADDILDESFLDELDAELEKATSGSPSDTESPIDLDLAELDDLEPNVTDEDLAFLEEVADADVPSLEQELDLDELLEEITLVEDELQTAAADPARDTAAPSISAADLSDEEDFDFLDGTDEAATKLDLARAYVEMGDADGARGILEEVTLEGSDEQQAEAQELLNKLS